MVLEPPRASDDPEAGSLVAGALTLLLALPASGPILPVLKAGADVPHRLTIRGSGWSPPPMGFYLGILTKCPPPRGGTQVTDFNKGITKGMFTNNIRLKNGGVRGTQTPSWLTE